MRQIFDLTHPIYDGLEGFPGNETIRIGTLLDIPDGGYHVSTVFTDTHTGTHIDVPCHVFPDGKPLDCLDLDKCIGPAVMLHTEKGAGEEITLADLAHEESRIGETRRLVIATGWSRFFGTPDFYNDFPGITLEAADWLAKLGVVFLGLEQPSVNPRHHLEVHHKLLENGIVVAEALSSPERIPVGLFDLICLPMSVLGADGAPARIVGIVES